MCLNHIGYMLLYQAKLTMSFSGKRNFGTKKITFDPKTTNHVGISNGLPGNANKTGMKPGVSNGLGLAGKPGIKLVKKTQVVQVKGEISSKTALGSPWGVLLKPVPSLRKTETQAKSIQPPAKAKLPVRKLSFKGPHDVEQLNCNKSELKKVNIVKNKTEVRLTIF